MQKYKFINFILIPILTFILVFLFLTVPSFASSGQSYFPFVQNNDNIPANVYGAVTSSFPLDQYYVFISSTGYYSWGNTNYPYFAISKQYDYPYATISQDGYHFSFYNGSSGSYGECRVSSRGDISINSGLNIYYDPYFQNLVSPLYDSSISYFMNFDLYTDSSEVVSVAFVTAPLTVPSTGHATSPTGVPTFSYPIGMHPTQAPTVPTYTVPTPSNSPSFDINQPFQSLFDILDYWFNFVVTLISGLIQVIIDWWQFIGELILWIFNYYIDWLNTFSDWLYNIFKFLFEPIYDFFSNFFNFLFNEDDQLSIFDLIRQFKDLVGNWFSSYWSNSFLSNFWTNFYNNLVSSYSEIADIFSKVIGFFAWLYNHGLDSNNEFSLIVLINYLLIPDSTQFQSVIVNHDQYGFVHSFGHLTSEADSLYDSLINLSPAYKITLRSFTLAGVIIPDIDIDFTWYSQYKSVGDGIISAFLILGYFYWLFTRFNGILRGSAGDVSQSVTEVKKL